jgi:flagellar basal-body rod modification protein FlgD
MTVDATTGTTGTKFAPKPTYTGPTAPVQTPTTKATMDKDDFLKLFVTQLRNQDPTSPLQPYELASQLAQFTSVEQLTNLNASLTKQLDAIAGSTLATQSSLGSSLIGRQVVTAGNQVTVPASGSGSVMIETAAQGTGTLSLQDDAGNELASVLLGEVGAGRQTLTLPTGIPAGTYRYAVSVKGPAGSDIKVTTYTTGVVTGLEFQDGKPMLRLGNLSIPLDSLVEVTSVSSPSTSQESSIL